MFIEIDYTNYKGERSKRLIHPFNLKFGSNQWHATNQYLLTAWDFEKDAERTFAMKDIHSWNSIPMNLGKIEISEISTGAIRSTDLKSERWDLISIYALNRLEMYINEEISYDIDKLLNLSWKHIYDYLWGRRECDHLGLGFRDLFIATDLFYCNKCCTEKHMYKLPYHPMQLLAQTCDEGAKKYGHHNWLYGFPIEQLLNHGIKHIVKIINVHTDENHWGHALWAFMAAIHMEETRPDMCLNLLGPNGTLTDHLKEQLQEHRNALAKD